MCRVYIKFGKVRCQHIALLGKKGCQCQHQNSLAQTVQCQTGQYASICKEQQAQDAITLGQLKLVALLRALQTD